MPFLKYMLKQKSILIVIFLSLFLFSVKTTLAAQLVIPDDRRIDWSSAGVPGGIPDRTTNCTTSACNTLCGSGAPTTCTSEGATVTAASISAAITSAGTDQVVRLPAGTFSLDSQLTIYKSHVVLRGMGKGETILQPTHAINAGDYHIVVGKGGYLDATGKSGGTPQEVRAITSGATKGSTSIVASDVSTLAVGQTILISAAKETWMWERNGTYPNLPTQIVMISDIVGNTIHFSPALTYDFSHNAAYARSLASIYGSAWLPYQYIGIEDLTIDGALSGANEANVSPSQVIHIANAAYSWIRNIEIKNFMASGISVNNGLQNTITGNTIHDGDAWRENHGVFLADNDTMNVVENNTCYNLWACAGAPWSFGGAGNVYSYNYSHNPIRFYSFINDYTGNDGPKIARSTTNPANVSWNNFTYYIHYEGSSGYATPYSKSASTVGVPLSGATVPQNKYGVWAVDVDASGTISIAEGTNNNLGYVSAAATTDYNTTGYLDALGQDVMNTKARVGWITVMSTDSGGFVPGTTALNAAGVTAAFNSRGANPSGYQLGSFMNNHGAGVMYNLWEGNVGEQWTNDNYHGSDSNITLFRNYIHGISPYPNRTGNRMLIDIGKFGRWYNVIGNVLGNSSWTPTSYELSGQQNYDIATIYRLGYPNCGNNSYEETSDPLTSLDTNVIATLARHQNYDYYNNAIKPCDGSTELCQGIVGDDLPDSLYLSQKPSWWCEESAWPPVNPKGTTDADRYSKIPAQIEFEGGTCTTSAQTSDTTPPSAPQDLSVI